MITFTLPVFILATIAIFILGIIFGVWLALNKIK
jgi:ABC-type dipeptide/oligopeptide/nickel transport system permease component